MELRHRLDAQHTCILYTTSDIDTTSTKDLATASYVMKSVLGRAETLEPPSPRYAHSGPRRE